MERNTRIALAVAAVAVAVAVSFWTLGPAPRLGAFLTLIVLAYAYGPTAVEGVAEA